MENSFLMKALQVTCLSDLWLSICLRSVEAFLTFDVYALGYAGPMKDVPTEKFNRTAVPKSYFSPWEQALISDPSLADMVHLQMPESEPTPEIPQYKSFNRWVLFYIKKVCYSSV